MIVLNVPKIVNRRVQWVRVTVDNGAVACKDAEIKREVERLKPIGGPPGWDPEPDWTLGRECHLWLCAQVLHRTPNGGDKEVPGIVC